MNFNQSLRKFCRSPDFQELIDWLIGVESQQYVQGRWLQNRINNHHTKWPHSSPKDTIVKILSTTDESLIRIMLK